MTALQKPYIARIHNDEENSSSSESEMFCKKYAAIFTFLAIQANISPADDQ